MKYSEIIFSLMDEVRQLIQFMNEYVQKGLELFNQIRQRVVKAIEYIEARINEFSYRVRSKTNDYLELSEEDMFV